MASSKLILLVIASLISSSVQDLDNNEIDIESNAYKEVENDIRKEQNMPNFGSVVQEVLQKEGSNIIGKLLKENSGQILQGIGSMLASQRQGSKKDSDSPDILGSLFSAFQDNADGEGGGAALLQGLGSLLGQAGQGQGASLLPVLGSIINQASDKKEGQGEGTMALLQGLGSLLNNNGGDGASGSELLGSFMDFLADDKNKDAQTGRAASKKTKSKPSEDQKFFNLQDALSMAANFLPDDKKEKQKNQPNFLAFLPMILQTVNSFVGPEAESRAKSHEGHAWALPPFLEKIHILFDHFIHSDMGKETIALIGAEQSLKVFMDDSGRFNYKKFADMMENHSYRRQWIRVVTDKMASILQYISQPKIYKAYFLGGQLFFNSYIKSLGFPKAALFDSNRPVETISAFINYVAKQYFQVKINAKEYVKPAFAYIKDAIKLAEKSGISKSLSDATELSNKLADTINLEMIEPLVRVIRGFRYIRSVPSCDRYILCLVNQENPNEVESIPGLKKLLYRSSSLLAGWFISAQSGTPFWTLYIDITDNSDCAKLYNDQCSEFHAEEVRVTTEYVHSEL